MDVHYGHSDIGTIYILNKQFVSVFTREEVTDIPKLHGPNYPDITDLGISTEGVEKLLSTLNVSKASGPNLIPCCLLKGLAEEIAPILAEIFRRRRRMYSPNLHIKLKPIKNHVMDGYRKGHMAIQAGGLKKQIIIT